MSSSSRADEPKGSPGDDALARELLRAVPEQVALPDFSELEAELERDLAKERGARAFLRELSTPRRFLLALLPLCVAAALTLLARARVDLALYPTARMALVLSVLTTLLLAGLVLSLWPLAWRPLPGLLRRLLLGSTPLSLLVLYSLPAAHTAHRASLQAEGSAALFVRAVPCLLIGSGVAAGSLLLLRAFDRGASRVSMVFAACAGLYANVLLQLHCSVTAPSHLLLGHLGVVLLVFAWVALRERLRAPE